MTTLLADIGGTHARFALLPDGTDLPQPAQRLALDAFADLAEAMRGFLDGRPRPRAAVLAVAGPVAGDRAVLTNRGWAVEGKDLAAALGFATVRLVNDFAALAWGLPTLGPAELLHLGGPASGDPAAPHSVVGPGTGLGVAAYLPGGAVLSTEGGHASLPATEEAEAAVLARLRTRFAGHVSAERGALSGQGIEALHAALGGDPARQAPAILDAALAGSDPRCTEAMQLFCAFLGGFAGDVALMHGAQGGVFIGGGICPRMPELLAASAFRARFEAKGRMRPWVAAVPSWLILDPEAAAMRGLAFLARRG